MANLEVKEKCMATRGTTLMRNSWMFLPVVYRPEVGQADCHLHFAVNEKEIAHCWVLQQPRLVCI